MMPHWAVMLLAKLGLPALLALLVAYRRHLAQRSSRGRADEIAFDRQYDRIEPESGQPDYIRGTGSLILRSHEWIKLAFLLAVIVLGIVAIREPLVRIILGITAIALVAIVTLWAYRRKVAQRGSVTNDAQSLSGRGPAI